MTCLKYFCRPTRTQDLPSIPYCASHVKSYLKFAWKFQISKFL
ncbi:unnamed protein product [Ceutorhynchus assimilis]|uniref:Uncharacterized protein n=1 Tax=Ceutorhynchus assimilis TaxID=467358 RepID=A0A9N9QJ26_9CUCU|nr:unnamed protein product [Ceutorhynchus assimilis]